METISCIIGMSSANWFKSYYVVWKLHHFIQLLYIIYLFKSYYVVWKPWLESKISFDDPRLNRTMQYGNDKEVSEKWETLCQFKSYYVVWKPEK